MEPVPAPPPDKGKPLPGSPASPSAANTAVGNTATNQPAAAQRPVLTLVEGSSMFADDAPVTGPADDIDVSRLIGIAAGYLREEDLGRIRAAFELSVRAHEGQYRISGEPYVSHPLAVSEILAQWHMDVHALIAGLLHDVMEDSEVTKADLETAFGAIAAELVDGVSKLDRLEFRSYEEAQAENYRKMFLAMARDVRVILIKLADRLHNMRTLDAVRPDKRRRIARETLEIYAPIANRLGLNTLYRELQELAFRHTFPMRYRVLAKALRSARGNRRELVTKLQSSIQERLPQWGIEAEVFGREKHLFGVYRKMVDKQLSFSQVLDIYGFRILVKDVASCYLALGALHELYKPVPGKFKDYIAIPKANGYQSVHTTVIGPFGTPVEVQIRTFEMHSIAQSGVASHWMYKDGSTTISDLQRKTHNWLQSLLELQTSSGDSSEFLEHVKIDLFPGDVFVFTPQGKILNLQRGSTAVDFAYAVHTDIGNRCVACRINGELLPLRTELKNGDQVEIVTATHANPNPAWLSYVRTGKARAQIRHFLKSAQHEEAAALGERLVAQALRNYGLALADIGNTAWERLLKDNGIKSRNDALTDVGLGRRLAAVVARRLGDLQDEHLAAQSGDDDSARPRNTSPILIHGGEGMAVQMARCCRPIPGDPIVGMLRKGQGLEVHVNDCPVLTRNRSSERDRWVEVEWETNSDRLFEVTVRVLAENRRGVLAHVAASIADQDSNIQNVSMDNERGAHTTIMFTLQVQNRLHLARIMRAVRRIPEVVRINRMRSDSKTPVERRQTPRSI